MRNELDIIAEKNYAREEGRTEGMAKGEAKGRAENSREIAGKLQAMGMSVEDIVKATGLSKEEIEGL